MTTSTIYLVPGVSGRYALALFELIEGSEKRLAQVDSVRGALTPELLTFLKNPAADNGQKEAVLAEVATTLKLEKTLSNFLKLVARKGRADLLPEMLADIQRLRENQNGVVKVDVRSATKLTRTQEKDIEKFVKQMAPNARTVDMTVGIDKSLIAGTRIQVGDKAFDNSVAGRMRGMAASLRRAAQIDE